MRAISAIVGPLLAASGWEAKHAMLGFPAVAATDGVMAYAAQGESAALPWPTIGTRVSELAEWQSEYRLDDP